MRRALGLIFVLALLLSGVGSSKSKGRSPATATAIPSGIVVFVDTEKADLMWPIVLEARSYKLYRDYGSIGTSLPVEVMLGTKEFARVWAASPGDATSYKVCAVLEGGSEDCGSWEIVHHESVKGKLYKDRRWSMESFLLDGLVQIMDAVTLTITNGATVSRMPTPSANPVLMTMPGSRLEIGGGGPGVTVSNIGISHLSATTNQSAIRGEEGKLVKLVGVQVDLDEAMTIKYCELTSGSRITRRAGLYGQVSDISHNKILDYSRIEAKGGKTDIKFNEFNGTPNPAIDVAESEVTIEKNSFVFGYGAKGIRVWPDTGGKVTIKDNSLQRMVTGANPQKALIFWRDTDSPSPGDPPTGKGQPVVIVEGNLIQGFDQCAKIGSVINVEMRRNTVIGNGSSVTAYAGGNLSRVIVSDNCLARNYGGLGGDPEMDATGNWWGSSLGPKISDGTPRGGGDFVYGVQYKPFLTESNCDPQAQNLSVHDIELVQVTQNNDKSVPLVEGKPTRVRVYVASTTGETSMISGELIVRRGGTVLGTRSSFYPGKAIYPTNDLWILRGELDNSIVFKLPTEWASGTLSITAVINTDYAYQESTHEDNDKSVLATFVKKRPVRAGLVPVRPANKQLQAGAVLDLESLLQMGELFRKVYPSHQVAYSILPAIDWPYEMVEPTAFTDYGKYGAKLLSALGVSQMRLQAEGGWAGQNIDQVYGAFPEGASTYASWESTRDGGRGTSGFGRSFLFDFNRALANNLGAAGPLLVSGGIQAAVQGCGTPVGGFGYDVAAEKLMPGDSTSFWTVDYEECPESYPRWIAPYNYLALFDYNDSAAMAQESAAPEADPQTYILISGVIEREPVYSNRLVEFFPIWQVTASAPPLNPPVGTEYCLELQDADDAVLESHCFDRVFQPGWTRFLGFQVALPLTGSPARVVMRRGIELGSIPVSANLPVVTIDPGQVQATSASLPISWSGSDSDGDSLSYSIQYSADDQATWLPAASNITETSYTLNLGEVPGGTQAWVRVQASDGFHTSSDVQGPFVVEDHGPLVSISSPESLGLIPADPTLSGYAYDLEDGELAGSDMVWTSSVDGPLGTGRLVYATGLTTGTHTLTLTATDSQGHSASDGVTVFVDCARDINAVFLPLVRR